MHFKYSTKGNALLKSVGKSDKFLDAEWSFLFKGFIHFNFQCEIYIYTYIT